MIVRADCPKRGYAGRKEARQALRRAVRQSDENRWEIRIYRCDRCRMWHLTSQQRRQ